MLLGTQAQIDGLENDVQREHQNAQKLRYKHKMTNDRLIENELLISTQQIKIKKLEKKIKKINKELKSQHNKMNKKQILEVCKHALSKDNVQWLINKLDASFPGSTSDVIAAKKQLIDDMNQKQIEKERNTTRNVVLQALEYYDNKLSKSQLQNIRNATNNELEIEAQPNGDVITRFKTSKWSNGYSKSNVITYQQMYECKESYLKHKALTVTDTVYSDDNDINSEYAVFANNANVAYDLYELLISSNGTQYVYNHHLTNIPDDQLSRPAQSALCLFWDGSTAKKVHDGSHIMVAAAKFSGWRRKYNASPKTAFFILMSNRSEDLPVTNTVLTSEINKISQIRTKPPRKMTDAYGRIHCIDMSQMVILV